MSTNALESPTVQDAVARLRDISKARTPTPFHVDRWVMSNVHLIVYANFRTQYERAPTIPKSDYTNWLFYCVEGVRFTKDHHKLEENIYFPGLEKKLPKEMHTNVEEHQSFERPLKDLWEYLISAQASLQYSPQEHRRLLGLLVDPMFVHLDHEMDTLDPELLRAHFTEKDLEDINAPVSAHIQTYPPTVFLPFVLGHVERPVGDVWPPFPPLVRYFLAPWVFYWKNRGPWKYCPYRI